MVSGQAALFALGHVILGCSAESICWAPGGLRGPPLLGLLQKAQLESVGRVCQRLENEPSQSPQGSERKDKDKTAVQASREVRVGNYNLALGPSYFLHAALTHDSQGAAVPINKVMPGFLVGDSWLPSHD